MKTSKLEPKKDFIAGALVAGISQEEVALKLGVNQSTISRFSSKEEIKTAIEEEAKSLLEVLPDAVGNLKDLVRGMKDIPISESKARELALKASFRVLETGGILPSHAPAFYIQQIFNRTNNFVSPNVERLLALAEAEIIEED